MRSLWVWWATGKLHDCHTCQCLFPNNSVSGPVWLISNQSSLLSSHFGTVIGFWEVIDFCYSIDQKVYALCVTHKWNANVPTCLHLGMLQKLLFTVTFAMLDFKLPEQQQKQQQQQKQLYALNEVIHFNFMLPHPLQGLTASGSPLWLLSVVCFFVWFSFSLSITSVTHM